MSTTDNDGHVELVGRHALLVGELLLWRPELELPAASQLRGFVLGADHSRSGLVLGADMGQLSSTLFAIRLWRADVL
jgi:hypothetical protein